jgi:hypothetical protein
VITEQVNAKAKEDQLQQALLAAKENSSEK